MSRVLSAPLAVSFDYTRSLGPVLSQFMTGLRERTVLGSRTADGRVVVPPVEFDPVTHEPLTELVEVAPTGTVQTWTWVTEPVKGQPFDRPFAFALVLLDGADTPMLHALDAPYDELRTGMRVQVRWTDEPVGNITDIACFEPNGSEVEVRAERASKPADGSEVEVPAERASKPADGSEVEVPAERASKPANGSEVEVRAERASKPADGSEVEVRAERASKPPVTGIITPVNLDYLYEASPEESAFFRGLAEGRILGQRCPKCRKVYVPPRGACPVDGIAPTEEVELPDHGIITTFCIVNVPFLGQKITPPYVSAYILLEGADIAFLHLILGVDASEVRMGMRVKAVWKPRAEWGTTVENIEYFEPTGEPDADYETYKDHL